MKSGYLTLREAEKLWYSRVGCRPDGLCDECGFDTFWEMVNELPDTKDDTEPTPYRLILARAHAYIRETRTA